MRSLLIKVRIGLIFVYPTHVEATCDCIRSLTFHINALPDRGKIGVLGPTLILFPTFKVHSPIVSTSNSPQHSDHWIELRNVKFWLTIVTLEDCYFKVLELKLRCKKLGVFFFFLRQKVDRSTPSFCQVERRFHSRESNSQPLP